jgi:hypothetical protein
MPEQQQALMLQPGQNQVGVMVPTAASQGYQQSPGGYSKLPGTLTVRNNSVVPVPMMTSGQMQPQVRQAPTSPPPLSSSPSSLSFPL